MKARSIFINIKANRFNKRFDRFNMRFNRFINKSSLKTNACTIKALSLKIMLMHELAKMISLLKSC